MINLAISLEQEYAIKAGYKTDVPDSVLKTIRDITDISLQAYAHQNKIAGIHLKQQNRLLKHLTKIQNHLQL